MLKVRPDLRPISESPSLPRSPALPGALAALISVALLASCPSAQTVAAPTGYVSNHYSLSPPPAFIGLVAIGGAGEFYTFDGTDLIGIDGTGQSRLLFTPPAGAFGEMLTLTPAGALLFLVSPSWDLYEVDPLAGGGTVVANLPYLYDMSFDSLGNIFASLGEVTFSTTTLELIDPVTYARQVFALLQGASGPLVVTPVSGEVLYGTNDFGLASQALLQFSAGDVATALATMTPLTEADAVTFASGLAGTTSLALDGDLDVYLAENDFVGGSSRIAHFTPLGVASTFVDAPAGFFFGRVTVSSSPDAFDPATGPGATQLGVVYSDFFSANRLVVIEPSAAAGRLFGDCNGDQGVSITDALAAAQSDIGLITITGLGRAQCDVDGSARVSVVDALLIALFDVGAPVTLGY